LEEVWKRFLERAWEWARGPIPLTRLDPVDWEDPCRKESAREHLEWYLRERWVAGGSPPPRPGPPGPGGGSETPGPCPFQISSTRREVYRVVVYRWGAMLIPRYLRRGVGGASVKRSKVRTTLGGSFRRLARLTQVLEEEAPAPTHLITLTLPPDAWEALPSDEVRVANFLRARKAFLHALRMRLRRHVGQDWGYVWWKEVQKRGAPHLHIVVRIGELDDAKWREWADWVHDAWARALGVPGRTRIEALRHADFRYVRAYATKAEQKGLPFPGPWGRAFGTAGVYSGYSSALKEKVEFLLDSAAALLLLLRMAHRRAAAYLGVRPEGGGVDSLARYQEWVPLLPDGSVPREWLSVHRYLSEGVPLGLVAWYGPAQGDVWEALDSVAGVYPSGVRVWGEV